MTSDKILAALLHVRENHEEITHVFFTQSGSWLYTDDEFNAPTFGSEVDLDVVDAAACAAFVDKGWPCAYSIVNGALI